MYSSLSATVRTDGGEICVFPCNVGTRQGDVSSPLIFALFINDLCTLLREQCGDGIFITPVADIFCLMYADDIANCAETRVRLQQQVNLIAEFCNSRDMKVNLNKTEIIVFRNGGPLRNYEQWTLNGLPIRTTWSISIWDLFSHLSSLGQKPSVSLQPKPEKLLFAYGITSVNLDISNMRKYFAYLMLW